MAMTLRELVDSAPNRNEILGALGLSTRRSPTDDPLLAAGIFGAGLLVGMAVGAVFGPKAASSIERMGSSNGARFTRRREFTAGRPASATSATAEGI
jgi:hypothetical protein